MGLLVGHVMNILRLVIFCIELRKRFLNVVFTLKRFIIEFRLNSALAVVCLFIYILFICLFTYFISLISRPQYDSTDTSNSNFCLLMIIDIKYVNKQMNNMYINKQTTAKAEFNPNSIKNLFNVKTTFKNLFHNLIQNVTNLKIFMTWPTRRGMWERFLNVVFTLKRFLIEF